MASPACPNPAQRDDHTCYDPKDLETPAETKKETMAPQYKSVVELAAEHPNLAEYLTKLLKERNGLVIDLAKTIRIVEYWRSEAEHYRAIVQTHR